MHELSVCQGLLTQVEQVAAAHHADRVDSIVVQVGPLAGVEIPLLEQAFTVVRAGTVAANARLVIEAIPLTVHCPACDKDSQVSMDKLVCNHCGNWRTQLISGDELILKTVELRKEKERNNV